MQHNKLLYSISHFFPSSIAAFELRKMEKEKLRRKNKMKNELVLGKKISK
jgi:hypothetical protein